MEGVDRPVILKKIAPQKKFVSINDVFWDALQMKNV
jgi:hypothetical protein